MDDRYFEFAGRAWISAECRKSGNRGSYMSAHLWEEFIDKVRISGLSIHLPVAEVRPHELVWIQGN